MVVPKTTAPQRAFAPQAYRVQQRLTETADTFTLVLTPEQPGDAMRFAPGQFNMLYAFGVGEVPISISGSPADRHTLVHTIREVGPATRALSKLRALDTLLLRGPFGTAWPVEAAYDHDVVLVTGGIGLAPLRPVLYHIVLHRSRYRNVHLLYGARTPGDLLFVHELDAWRAANVAVEVTVDRSDESWRGDVGVVTRLLDRARFAPERTIAMTCGPEVMMHFAGLDLRKRGVPRQNIFVSMERNMQCGVGTCGHCQLGPFFVCKDGPVFNAAQLAPYLLTREL